MIILSFDVGIINLAYCIIEISLGIPKILYWEIITLENQQSNYNKLYVSLITEWP